MPISRCSKPRSQQVEGRLNAEPNATLETLEALPGWTHFPYSILASAVLYSKKDPANPGYHDPKMLALTLRIGDFQLRAKRGAMSRGSTATGTPTCGSTPIDCSSLNSARSRKNAGVERSKKIVVPLVPDTVKRLDFPWYNSPYIGTSPNHYAQWASLLMLAGMFSRIRNGATWAPRCCTASLPKSRVRMDIGGNTAGPHRPQAMTM